MKRQTTERADFDLVSIEGNPHQMRVIPKGTGGGRKILRRGCGEVRRPETGSKRGYVLLNVCVTIP